MTFNELIQEEKAVDEWLVEGNTFLIPKSEENQLPHKYRPMACLPTTNTLLPGIITEMMHHHRTQQGGLEAEQKGCKRRCGTIDHLLLNKAVSRIANAKNQIVHHLDSL